MATSSIRSGASLTTGPTLRCGADQKRHVHPRIFLFLSKGRLPSIYGYSDVANSHLPFGWSRSNSHCPSFRISDTRFEGGERHCRNATGTTTLGCGFASVLPAWLPPSTNARKIKCGKASESVVVNRPFHSLRIAGLVDRVNACNRDRSPVSRTGVKASSPPQPQCRSWNIDGARATIFVLRAS